MLIVVIILLLLGIHFAGTVFVPGPKARVYWPFGENSKPIIPFVGGLPKQGGSVLTPLLAGVAVLAYLAALLALFGVLVPADWWRLLVIIGAFASAMLHILYFSPLMILPLVVDVALLLGVFLLNWSVAGLR
jgi:hypothetical protein